MVFLFILLLVSFCLHIAYRKVKSLQIGVHKLLGNMLVNLLSQAKSAACVISIIIDIPIIAYPIVSSLAAEIVHLNK